ncbi:ATP-binding protein [Clostridium tarantellae]|uniref:ATP-binding protein n=1 Tax=Clostridium tarantellae TaxID=39493 RepID=A0A6I1MNL4_9CLOT|nr:ATP-binding protein [Clostridium tarantellae]MPQ44068.1 ATP-binding protein [Clostridium tarantellae]
MFSKESIPFAPSLIESMRSLGYSFEAAIADLIDNSISANANKIDIRLSDDIEPYMIIFDNGHGMTSCQIEDAMRYGSKNPLDIREKNDLGRFGLGLKSASLSHCRKLVVISKKNNETHGYSWDLDYVIEQGAWMLIGYNEEELKEFPEVDMLNNVESGTYILLQKFDRIQESTNNLQKTLNRHMDTTIDHIALVFHRFLEKEIDIYVNSRKVEGRDPFLITNKATQRKREQNLNISGATISVKPYILPHVSKLKKSDLDKIGGKDRLKSEQGFYIYRNRRLIIWGTWFRLERKDELSKLARVQVDIPNDLDYMWNIDIKKSSANLPDLIKKNLYNCVYEAVLNSESVHSYRGRKVNGNEFDYVWERIENRGAFEYKINRKLPQIKLLEATLNKEQINSLDDLLNQLEETLPVATLYIDAAKGNINEKCKSKKTEELFEEVMEQIEFAKSNNFDYKKIAESFLKTEPYCMNDELKLLVKEKVENE